MAKNTLRGSHSNNLPSTGNTIGTFSTSVAGFYGKALSDELRIVAAVSPAGELTLGIDGKDRANRLRIRVGVVADAADSNGDVKTVGPSLTLDLNSKAGIDTDTGKAYTVEAIIALRQRMSSWTDAQIIAVVDKSYALMGDFKSDINRDALDASLQAMVLAGI